jgi:division protein CdvB (Snf7/Vps24/ESCRT-III family)
MSFLFGGTQPTTAELARRYKLTINRSVREIDREMAQMQAQERGYMAEIRKFAPNNPTIARQKAQAVASGRKTITRFALMKSQLQEIGSRILSVRSAEALENALRSANRAMSGFQSRIGTQSLVTILHDFEKHSNRMTEQAEVADDMLDDVFDSSESGFEEEIGDIVESVLQAVGVILPDPPRQAQRARIPSIPTPSIEDLEALRPEPPTTPAAPPSSSVNLSVGI